CGTSDRLGEGAEDGPLEIAAEQLSPRTVIGELPGERHEARAVDGVIPDCDDALGQCLDVESAVLGRRGNDMMRGDGEGE
ncbi:hypothetical protein DN545_36665, partial [Burkholderia multivorans]